MALNTIVDIVTLAVLGFISFLLTLGRGAVQKWVETSVTEEVKTAIYNRNWIEKLAQELEKARGVERQEIRFKNYGALWAKLRPLAMYDFIVVDSAEAKVLSKALTDWYFSESGGLLLTAPVREFYFALQDLLQGITKDGSNWDADRSSENPKQLFSDVLTRTGLDQASNTLEELDTVQWPPKAEDVEEKWKKEIRQLATCWNDLSPVERFAVLQQVGSVLRTSMTRDVESRLR